MGMDVSGRNPSSKDGEYFRANVWSWRPIHQLCETVMGQQYPSWAYNDGEGLKTQEECTVLADRLENYLNKNPNEQIALESDCRVDENGRLLPHGSLKGRSAYYTSHEHVRKFITFLRACGGFEIW